MKTTPVLTMGTDAFTLLDLIRKAAEHKGLKIQEGASRAYRDGRPATTGTSN